jgi:hypothetical protein
MNIKVTRGDSSSLAVATFGQFAVAVCSVMTTVHAAHAVTQMTPVGSQDKPHAAQAPGTQVASWCE